MQLGIEPVHRRAALADGDDLHRLPVAQRGLQRHHLAVDARAAAAVADVGVQRVGEVHGRAAGRQLDDAGLGCEHVDAIFKGRRIGRGGGRLALGLGHEFALPREQLAQHGLARLRHLVLERTRGADARVALGAGLLVGPVRGHAVLGVLMHLARADLHLERTAGVVLDHRVQRLVAVGLGLGDVVVELAVDRAVALVDAPQHGVAGGDVVDDHAYGADVEHVVEVQLLAAHLLPDAVDVLGPALDVGTDAGGGQHVHQLLAERDDAGLALHAALVQQPGDAAVLVGLEEAERQVLQLPLDLPDAQPVGQGREHLLRLSSQLGRARRAAGGVPTQRLQARREAQQHHPQVARERQQHLAHALGLQRAFLRVDILADLRLPCVALDLHQLAREVHHARVRRPERLGDHLDRALQPVARIDQEGRRLHGGRGAEVGQDLRDAFGMRPGGLAAVEDAAREQRLRERPRARQRIGVAGLAVGALVRLARGPGHVGRGHAHDRRRVVGGERGRLRLHGDARKARTSSI